MIVDDRQRVRLAALQQFRRGVQPLRILQLGQVEAEFRKLLRRRQAILDEAVAHHSGTTAVASISTFAVALDQPHDLDQRHRRIMRAHDLAPGRADLVRAMRDIRRSR